jgi:hypothetical protein
MLAQPAARPRQQKINSWWTLSMVKRPMRFSTGTVRLHLIAGPEPDTFATRP